MTVDLDALELRAKRFQKLNPLHECFDSATVLALIAELRQERERADEAANHAELALAGRRNAVADLARERERADGEAHDARHLRSVRDGLRDDIANLEAELRQERAKVRGLGFALEGTQAERDRLHKAITEIHEWWYSAKAPRVRYSEYLRVSAILRAALDKEGQADE